MQSISRGEAFRACAKSDEEIKKTLLCKIGVEATI
jgi:hypothetical protein